MKVQSSSNAKSDGWVKYTKFLEIWGSAAELITSLSTALRITERRCLGALDVSLLRGAWRSHLPRLVPLACKRIAVAGIPMCKIKNNLHKFISIYPIYGFNPEIIKAEETCSSRATAARVLWLCLTKLSALFGGENWTFQCLLMKRGASWSISPKHDGWGAELSWMCRGGIVTWDLSGWNETLFRMSTLILCA